LSVTGGTAGNGDNNGAGGAGGAIAFTTGLGGNGGSSAGIGGNGGLFSITTANGGTAPSGSSKAGGGGDIQFTLGNGEASSADNGIGGSFFVIPGIKGAGAGAASKDGVIALNGSVVTDDSIGTVTVTSCGASPSIQTGSSNFAGRVTVGTGSTTACSVVFTRAFTTVPACVVNNNTTVQALRADAATNFVIIRASTSFASDVLSWICVGLNGE
jgi:hypothetical protein